MRKIIVAALLCAFMFSPLTMNQAQASDAGAATVLSLVLPGVGEWYNNDWEGAFPFAECVVGSICCFFQISSAMDAANGNDDTAMRFDFWTAPR